METSEAISLLANKCRTNEKHFGFAGTKDRRGRTTQRVSVSMVSAQQILGAGKQLYKLDVGNFSYDKKEIRLGDLTGNRFELGIRNVEVSSEQLEPVMKSLSDIGFINYFGTQRFGTQGVPTHFIGKELISCNYETAIDLILKPRNNESNEGFIKARKIWSEERDAAKALDMLKSHKKDRSIEGKLLYGLKTKHKNDSVGILEVLPRPTRLLYCHAYQSYLWNKVVSRRIKVHGVKVLPGDLVMESSTQSEDTCKEDAIKIIDNVEDYTIQDVLIPIPGTKVKFPNNEIKDWFEQYLSEDNLSLESFNNSVKDYNLPGDYRAIIVKPNNVQWRLQNYSDAQDDLIPSAKDKFENKTVSVPNDGDKKALLLNFSLPSSSYATMVLREIMKVETDRASMVKSSLGCKRANCDNNVSDDHSDKKVPKNLILC